MAQQAEPYFTFHLEHIVAKQHGGSDDAANLAWACHYCNSHKGPNLTGIDPDTGLVERLFNPREDSWDDHFQLGQVIEGRTPTGRTTTRVLRMNDPGRVELRRALGILNHRPL